MKHLKYTKNYLYDFVIVVTVKKERDILKFIKQIKRNLLYKKYCLIFYFDKSRDLNTFNTFCSLRFKFKNLFVVYNPKVKNLADAYYNAYLYASKINSKWVISMNAGFRHQPGDLKLFVNKLNNNLDCIWGYRGVNNKKYSFIRQFVSYFGNLLSKKILNISIKDPTSGFYAIRSNLLLKKLSNINGFISKYHFFDTELKYYLRKNKFSLVKIRYKTYNKGIHLKILIDSLLTLIKLTFKKN